MNRKTPFRFLHAADLHLGTAFKGLKSVNPRAASVMIQSTYRAFDNLLQVAIERQVDLVVLAGDLVDVDDKNLRALLHLQRGFKRLQEHEIKVCIVHGNHDPLGAVSSAINFPENVTVFPHTRGEWLSIKNSCDIPVYIWGISFKRRTERRNLARMVPRNPPKGLRIGLLHCTVGSGQGHEPYAPCTLSELRDSPCNYWALGHIHKKEILSTEPFVIYPGNIQGRSFKEQGPRGCFVVDVDMDFDIVPTFIETDVARWMELVVDVTDLSGVSQLMDKMYESIETLLSGIAHRALICRFRLEGICSFYHRIYAQEHLEEISQEIVHGFENSEPVVMVSGIENQAIPAADLEKRKKAGDLVAYVLREADRLELDPVKLTGPGGPLAQLFQNRRFSKFAIDIDKSDIKQIVSSAQHLLLHLLEDSQK